MRAAPPPAGAWRDAGNAARRGGPDDLGGRGVAEQDARVGVGDHARQAGGRGAGCQRCHGHARAQRAQEHGRVVHRRGRAHGNGVAGLQAVALQAGGDAVHQRVERAVVQRALRVGQGGVVGVVFGVEANQVGNGAEIAFHRGLKSGVHERVSPSSWPAGRIAEPSFLASALATRAFPGAIAIAITTATAIAIAIAIAFRGRG
jgi:hypothetical protein